jgi:hypothetical protein
MAGRTGCEPYFSSGCVKRPIGFLERQPLHFSPTRVKRVDPRKQHRPAIRVPLRNLNQRNASSQVADADLHYPTKLLTFY